MISSDLRRFGPPEATELNTEGEQGRVHLQYDTWLKMASTLSDDTAPSASPDHLEAQAAPTHPRAPPEHLGSSPGLTGARRQEADPKF